MQKGDIVKIYKTNNNIKSEWMGFTSELLGWWGNGHFMMKYGNKARKEYSEMNFYDGRCIELASDEEVRIYNDILPMVQTALTGVDKVYAYASQGSFIKDIEEGEHVEILPWFNVYNGEVYAAHATSWSKIKVWDKDAGLCSFRNRRILLLD